jgi:hypothetical protein
MKARKKSKHQHRSEEFSESEDEHFEEHLASLGEKAENEYQSRVNNADQNHLNTQGSTGAKRVENEDPDDGYFDF